MAFGKGDRQISTLRPLTAAASAVGGLIFLASAAALAFPAVRQYLAAVNLSILLLSVFINHYALSLVKEREERLRRMAAEREALVDEARRNAEAGEKVGRAIISNMTHEFRTPLNSVIGFAELLAEGETDETRAEMARCVQRGGWELLALVNSLVKAAELSNSDAAGCDSCRFTLPELVAAVCADHEPEAKAKGLRFALETTSDRPLIGERDSIVAVLGILVSNAVKYSEKGEIALRARELNVSDGNGTTVEFAVADKGRGMAPETLNRIFRPLEQGEDPLTKRYPGAGIGLYTAKRLTDRLRGDLRVESKIGVGTTAYLIVPLEAASEQGE
jgi:signal transduction histidine kinase